MKSSLQAYRETQIKTANQGTLIVMLYDGALRFVNTAIEKIESCPDQLDAISNYIIKTQDVITELMVSLDLEKGGEVAANLFRIYVFLNQQLIEGNLKKEVDPLRRVKDMLSDLREAWSEVAKKNIREDGSSDFGGVNIAG